MHLKQRLIAVTAVAAMAAALLYGGTRKPGEDRKELPVPSDSKETIYFWYTDDSMTEFVNSAAVTFGEKEDVRVIPVPVSGSEYLEAVNQASLHSDQMPDVYLVSHEALEKAYLAGLAGEIDDVEGVCDSAHFPTAALAAVTYRGKLVAYPLFFQTSVLLYNETYLDEWAAQSAQRELLGDGSEDGEPSEDSTGIAVDETALAQKTEEYRLKAVPATVDDILNIADTFDVPEGVDVMRWDVSDIFYNYWIVGNYMTVGGESGDDSTLVDIANPETVSCLEVYKALNQFFSIESDTVTYENVIQDFQDGKLVFTIATTDAAARLAQAKEEGSLGFEYGFAPVPDVSAELQSRSMSVTNAVAVNGYSAHRELANRFAAFLVNDCAEMLYQRTGKIPANLNANAEDGAVQIFRQEYADSIPLPKMMETGNYWLYLERLFAMVWNGEDVETLVKELEQQISFQLGAGVVAQ